MLCCIHSLPGPGIEPASPAQTGRFLTTGPPGTSYCAHLCIKSSLGISKFFEEIFSLYYSIVSFYFFALINEAGFLLSPYYSLELCIEMDIAFLFLLCLSLLFSALFKKSSDNHFAFLHFFFLGDALVHCLLYNVTKLCS